MIIEYMLGTAFVINSHLFTAGHVVEQKNTHDVAVVEIDPTLFPEDSGLQGKCRKLKVGETLTIKGYPLVDGKRNYTEVKGKFLGYNTKIVGDVATESLMINATIHGGISGGPIVDSKGYVVGIVHHKGQLVQNNKFIDAAFGASWCEVK